MAGIIIINHITVVIGAPNQYTDVNSKVSKSGIPDNWNRYIEAIISAIPIPVLIIVADKAFAQGGRMNFTM
ncbi:hypothetical protein SDC9_110186 [bioreactor metagenome]|uniref:Uncharacterized protein n=1 Tax=bioreactor metagenome TaxID=1076179 RepID=A0A645BDX3_9ZZZZ